MKDLLTMGMMAANRVRNAVAVTSNLTFTTNTLLTNTAQVFSPTSGAGYGHTGLDTINITAGQAARIYWQYKSADGDFAFIGINTANAQTGYTGMEWGIQLNTGLVYLWQSNASFSTGVTLNNNDWIGIFMCGGVAKIQRSTDGTTWTDLQIYRGYYPNTYPQTLYIVCDLFTAGLCKMYYPKVDLYGAGTAANLIVQDGNSLGIGQLNPGNFSTSNIGQQGWITIDTANNYSFKNTSTGGNSIATRTAALPTAVFPLFSNNFGRIIVAMIEGTNSLVTKTAAASFADMETYIDTVLNEDSRTRVLIYPCVSCNTTYFADSKRVDYNNLLYGITETSRLKVVDISGTAALNDALAWQNLTYYQADGVHLTQAGYDLLYSVAEPVLESF